GRVGRLADRAERRGCLGGLAHVAGHALLHLLDLATAVLRRRRYVRHVGLDRGVEVRLLPRDRDLDLIDGTREVDAVLRPLAEGDPPPGGGMDQQPGGVAMNLRLEIGEPLSAVLADEPELDLDASRPATEILDLAAVALQKLVVNRTALRAAREADQL